MYDMQVHVFRNRCEPIFIHIHIYTTAGSFSRLAVMTTTCVVLTGKAGSTFAITLVHEIMCLNV